jgi:membrane protein
MWAIIKLTFKYFLEKRVLKLSAALAYYTIFAIPGLLIIVIWISDFFYGRAAIEGTIYGQISSFVGDDAALQIQQTIRNATSSSEGRFATIIGFATLILGATSMFSEIQDSINFIWRLKTKAKKGWGILKIIFNRLLSFSMIIVLGFLALVSLLINGIMQIFIGYLQRQFPDVTVYVVYGLNILLTFLITAFLFGIIFKVLPDAHIKWKDVRAGAVTTAILFMVGKFAIGYYLGQNRMSSAYGAAGSVIVILLWVYYSAVILYLGACFTRAYAHERGWGIYPNSYAVWVEQVELESKEDLHEHKEIIK